MNIVLGTLAVALSATAPSTAPPSTAPPSSAPASSAPASAALPEGFVPLIDDTGSIVIAAREGWTDVDTAPVVNDDGSSWPHIAASPNIESFLTTFDTPGVAYSALPYTDDPLTVARDFALATGCETFEVRSYDDPVFEGIVQVGTDCGPDDMTWNLVVASPADHSFTAVLQAQAVSPRVLRTLLLTFNSTDELSISAPATTTAG